LGPVSLNSALIAAATKPTVFVVLLVLRELVVVLLFWEEAVVVPLVWEEVEVVPLFLEEVVVVPLWEVVVVVVFLVRAHIDCWGRTPFLRDNTHFRRHMEGS
jgi:hypothetical protein